MPPARLSLETDYQVLCSHLGQVFKHGCKKQLTTAINLGYAKVMAACWIG
jgi:hypothetical protein